MFAHMTKNQPLIGSAQAAARLGVNRATFNRWVQAGQVPVAGAAEGRTGARMFDPEVIDQLAAERTSPATVATG